MPTPPHIQIVPGTLCWFRGNPGHPNNGAILEVVRACEFFADYGKFWFVKAKVPMHVMLVPTTGPAKASATAVWLAGKEFTAKESRLVPIAGPGLVDHVENFDSSSRPETIGQLLRDAGLAIKPVSARSTPNVSR